MRKFVFLISIILFILSCTSQRKILDSWLGQTKHKLIMNWGPPARIESDGAGGEILVYANEFYMPNQYGPAYHAWNYTFMYANSSGIIYHWLTRSMQIPPSQIDVRIYRNY